MGAVAGRAPAAMFAESACQGRTAAPQSDLCERQMKVAVIGAGGFIGSHTAEVLHTDGLAEVRPVVRRAESMPRLERLDLDVPHCRCTRPYCID